jgi:pimeloyl-ACP methyl ester carboxylesterase
MHVDVNGTGIEVEVGEGRPVVLLHGFPDSSRLWRHQIAALSDAGFKAIAPDLRGYGGSDKPTEIEAYSLLFLAGDVIGVPRSHGRSPPSCPTASTIS